MPALAPGKSVEEIRSLFTGPVNSLPTMFTKGGDVDEQGMRNVIEAGVDSGCQVTMLTGGDSQFQYLSDEEIADLTRLVVEQVGGRTVTIAANKPWPLVRNLEFAQFARDTGADLLMVNFGEPTATQPPDLADCFVQIAAVIPVMLVGFPDHGVLDQLCDEPRICCFKEDGSEAYAAQTIKKYGDRWKMMTGGQLWRHFTQWPFGCRAFLSHWAGINPAIVEQYWVAMINGDLDTACRVIIEKDVPLFDLALKYKAQWQGIWRGALELNGVAQRYLRPPAHSLSDDELAQLKEQLTELGILL